MAVRVVSHDAVAEPDDMLLAVVVAALALIIAYSR